MAKSGMTDIQTLPLQTITGDVALAGLSIAGKISLVSVDNTQWWPLPVVPQPKRNSLAIQNTTLSQILIGFDPLAPLTLGWLIYVKGEFSIDVTNDIPVYAVALSAGTFAVTVMELS